VRRRALLAAAGTTLSAGCLDRLDGERPVTAHDCPPAGVAPDGPEQPLEAYTVCSHTVEPEEARVYALPSRTSVASVEDLEFTVYNDIDYHVTYDSWRLYRYEDGEWVELDPVVEQIRRVTVEPGETVSHSAKRELERFGVTPPVDGTFAATETVEMPGYEPPLRMVVLFRVY